MDVYMIYMFLLELSINNGNGITLEELEKERETLYENYSRNFG